MYASVRHINVINFAREQQHDKIGVIPPCLLTLIHMQCELCTVNIQTHLDSRKGDGVDWTCQRLIDGIPFDPVDDFLNPQRSSGAIFSLLKQQPPRVLGRGCLSVSITL